ncbi:MAG: hypothetical protein HOV79_27010 [Hamadaea sp.]|nr:hypothetical protein [Hamadaea sp.]
MRHLGTVIAALVIAPLAWLLLAYGQGQTLQKFAGPQETGAPLDPQDFLRPLVFLAAAGVLLGLIATLRFSPLGAVLTGLAYVGIYALLLVKPQRTLDALPDDLSIAGLHIDATAPLRTGTSALVGAMMLIALVSIGRWRRWPDKDASFWDRSYDDDRTSTTISSPITRRDPWLEPDNTPERQPANLLSWTSTLRR